MARTPRDNSDEKAAGATRPDCGIIMPISATVTHSEQHWREVQILLHRAVSDAGFSPRNVWESSTTDRVSERIIGNIFNFPLAVADVSDLNPNVMFELGLRLASKKPTIVVVNNGGSIPFDIRDFHAVFYPIDLNMLAMEEFFVKLSKTMRDKYAAYTSENYKPFLSNVIVDVASPETREVGVNELLLSRLDDLAERLSRIEISGRPSASRISPPPPSADFSKGYYDFKIHKDRFDEIRSTLNSWYEVDRVMVLEEEGDSIQARVLYSGGVEFTRNLFGRIESLVLSFGGEMEIPF